MVAATPSQVVTLRRLETFPKRTLQWLMTIVELHVDEAWRPQVAGALERCIEAYDDSAGGYVVEYHKKIYGGEAIGRQWASCGMQRLYAPFRGAMAKHMRLRDWDMVNAHPTFLVQICGRLGISCKLLADYVENRGTWLSLVITTVNTAATCHEANDEDSKAAAPNPIGRTEAKNLFIRVMYLGNPRKWYKDHAFNGTIPKVEDLANEMKRIGKVIAKKYPDQYKAVKVLPKDTQEFQEKNPLSRTLSLILGEIEDKCLMAAMNYVELLGLVMLVLVYDGFMIRDDENLINAVDMSEHVFKITGFRVEWDQKELDDTIKLAAPLNDEIVAGKVVKEIEDRVLVCNDICFSYSASSGLWSSNTKPALVIQEAINEWSISKKIYSGFNTASLLPMTIDLGMTTCMARVAAWARTKIPKQDLFLVEKHVTTHRKIKFANCVYNLATGQARAGFLPEEKFMVHVPRNLPARVEEDVCAARSFVQDLFTLPGVDTAQRRDDYNFECMSLWQFVLLAIGAALAGDVDVKLMYAMIGPRNSGKGMLMAAVGAAFGTLVDAGKSANNLLANESSTDEAKKYLWLADAAIRGTRLVWANEIRTIAGKNETYIDGNLVKGIASGGDPLEIRKQYENPYPARHEFTMFLNCNDLPPVRPSIGGTFLRVRFPNKYVEAPTLPNEKRKDDGLKRRLALPSFSDGMLWLIIDEYCGFLSTGKEFKAIPEVVSETADADEAEGEDIIEAFGNELEFAPPFTNLSDCRRGGFLMLTADVKEVIDDLKKKGKFKGVTKAGIFVQLGHRGYPKSPRVRYDDGAGEVYTRWIMGIKMPGSNTRPGHAAFLEPTN